MYLIELQHNPEEKCDKREKIHVVGDANSLLSVIDHKQTKNQYKYIWTLSNQLTKVAFIKTPKPVTATSTFLLTMHCSERLNQKPSQ